MRRSLRGGPARNEANTGDEAPAHREHQPARPIARRLPTGVRPLRFALALEADVEGAEDGGVDHFRFPFCGWNSEIRLPRRVVEVQHLDATD